MARPYFIALALTTLLGLGALSSAASDRPTWVNSPGDFCPPSELCAVGEGSGKLSAAAAARHEIARIFETKVEGKTTTHSRLTEKDSAEGPSGESEQSLLTEVKETSEEILQGVEVPQYYETADRFYALASLKRLKASELLVSKMKVLDEKNVLLLEEGRRTGLYRLQKNLDLRRLYEVRYQILRGTSYDSPVAPSDVMKKKAELRQNRTLVALALTGEEEVISSFLVNLLLEMDFKIVSGDEATYTLEGDFKSDSEHFNVKGFERYNFNFNLVARDNKGAKVGGVAISTVETGRSKNQAREKALPKLQQELIDTIDQLNIN